MSSKQSKRKMEAEEFILKDKNGNERASLVMGVHGPVLNFYDEDRNLRLSLSASDRGPNVEFYSPQGTAIASLGMADEDIYIQCTFRQRGIEAEVKLVPRPEGLGLYDKNGYQLCFVEGRRFKPIV